LSICCPFGFTLTVNVAALPCVNDAAAGDMVIVTAGVIATGCTVTVRLSCPKAEPLSPMMERVAM
jgi:hypothetical protein